MVKVVLSDIAIVIMASKASAKSQAGDAMKRAILGQKRSDEHDIGAAAARSRKEKAARQPSCPRLAVRDPFYSFAPSSSSYYCCLFAFPVPFAAAVPGPQLGNGFC